MESIIGNFSTFHVFILFYYCALIYYIFFFSTKTDNVVVCVRINHAKLYFKKCTFRSRCCSSFGKVIKFRCVSRKKWEQNWLLVCAKRSNGCTRSVIGVFRFYFSFPGVEGSVRDKAFVHFTLRISNGRAILRNSSGEFWQRRYYGKRKNKRRTYRIALALFRIIYQGRAERTKVWLYESYFEPD